MRWHKEIRATRTSQELLALARDFVARLSPEEVATLPLTCREIRIKGTDDLVFWHERLAEEFFALAPRDDASTTHRDLLDFFTIASERVSELGGNASDDAARDNLSETTVRGGKRVLH